MEHDEEMEQRANQHSQVEEVEDDQDEEGNVYVREHTLDALPDTGDSLPPALHAEMELYAGRHLSSGEAIAIDRHRLEWGHGQKLANARERKLDGGSCFSRH